MEELYSKYLDIETSESILYGNISAYKRNEIIETSNNLLRIVSTYIPRNIALARIEHGNINKHRYGFISGTLLVADVNGFTALTEKLTDYGKEGSEEITRILNIFFKRMVDIIYMHKGVLVKYGGDAMMILIPSDEAFAGNNHAEYAFSCATAMTDAMNEFENVESKFGTFSLSISLGVKSGRFFEAILGIKDIRLEYFISGDDVEKAAHLESSAGKNEVLTDKSTYLDAEDTILDFEMKDNYYKIKKTKALEASPSDESIFSIDFENLDDILTSLDNVASFLMQGILNKIHASKESLLVEGEHRPCSVMFLNFYSDKSLLSFDNPKYEKELFKFYNTYFSKILEAVTSYDGTINKIDMYTKGDKLMILFGALRASKDDNLKALKCAIDILNLANKFTNYKVGSKDISIHQKIGINSGFIYAGNVGSILRKEYTIMGDSVNLSARIMSACQSGKLYISKNVYSDTKSYIDIEAEMTMQFKGKSKPQSVYSVKGLNDNIPKVSEIFIGRDKELEIINKLSKEAGNSFWSVHIKGPVGVGKTSLVRRFINRYGLKHNEIIIGRSLSFSDNIQYYSVKSILNSYFGITTKDTPKGKSFKIDNFCNKIKTSENILFAIPLVGSLLGAKYKDSPVLKLEDPIEKKELLFSSLLWLLKERAKINPIYILFEDAEWIDHNSFEFLSYLISSKPENTSIFILSRDDMPLHSSVNIIELDNFSEEETYSFLDNYKDATDISEKQKEEIYKKTSGNPYYIHELVISLLVDTDDNQSKSDSIYKSVLSRFDLLNEKAKKILCASSIIGFDFGLELLKSVSPQEPDVYLSILEKGDFIKKKNDLEYSFYNLLVKDVAYNILSVKERKRYHLKIALQLEKEVSYPEEIIAFHFKEADIKEKAAYYFDLSGDNAFKVNNYPKALEYYNLVLEMIDKLKESEELLKAKINTLSKTARILYITSSYKEAEELLLKALDISNENNITEYISNLYISLGQIRYCQSDFLKASYYYNLCIESLSETEDQNDEHARVFLNISNNLKALNNISQAEIMLKKALEIYLKLGDEIGTADVYNNLGSINKIQLDEETALDYYTKALDIYNKSKNKKGLANIYNNIGNLYFEENDFDKSTRNFKKSLDFEIEIGNEKGMSAAYINLANSCLKLNHNDLAKEYFFKALEIAEKIKDINEIAAIHSGLGSLYMKTSSFKDANRSFKTALDIFTSIENNFGCFNSLKNLYLLYENEGIGDAALEYLEKSLNISQNIDEKTYLESLFETSLAYYKRQKFIKSRELCSSCINLINNNTLKSFAVEIYRFASDIESQYGDKKTALSYLKEVNDIKESTGDKKGSTYTKMNMAFLMIEQGEEEIALNILKSASIYYKENNDAIPYSMALNKIGHLYLKLGNHKEALNYFEKCGKTLDDLGIDFSNYNFQKNIGLLHLKMGDENKALDKFSSILKLEEDEITLDVFEVKRIMGIILFEQQKYDDALPYLLESYKIDKAKKGKYFISLGFLIGKSMVNLGLLSEAIEYFQKCISSDNDTISVAALKELSSLYITKNDFKMARATLRNLLNKNGDLKEKNEIKEIIDKIG